MKNKFSMTQKENIFVAKRNIVDYIWKSARLEGIGVTYPDTEAIFEGAVVQGISLKDTLAINNLKRAWLFVLDNIDYDIDLNYICKINSCIGGDDLIMRAGWLREIPVRIGGTEWQPGIPNKVQIDENIKNIHCIDNPTERAITLMLYCMREQMFLDGNKRTAMLAGNQIMIKHGVGVISIPIKYQSKFIKELINYYETNNMTTIKEFVYQNCIDGMDFEMNQYMEQGFTINSEIQQDSDNNLEL